jgi:hypothetical protein
MSFSMRIGRSRTHTPVAWYHRIRDRRVQADIADFVESLDAEIVDRAALFGEQNRFDRPDIRVDRDHVPGQVVIHIAAREHIELSRLMKGRPDAPYLGAHQLAFRRLGVDDPTRRIDPYQSWNTNFAGGGMYARTRDRASDTLRRAGKTAILPE